MTGRIDEQVAAEELLRIIRKASVERWGRAESFLAVGDEDEDNAESNAFTMSDGAAAFTVTVEIQR